MTKLAEPKITPAESSSSSEESFSSSEPNNSEESSSSSEISSFASSSSNSEILSSSPAESSSSWEPKNSEKSSFAYSSSEMMKGDMEMASLEVLTKLKVEEKEKFEIAYGLYIEDEALTLISSIVVRFFYASIPSIKGKNCGSPSLALLQEKAVELLKNSCTTMIHKLEINEEELTLDKYEYMLYRAFIEFTEIQKEKDHATRIWAPRVESEYNDLMNMWERFMGTHWKESGVSDEEILTRDVHIHVLKEELVDLFPSLQTAMGTHDVAHVSCLVQKVGAITNEMLKFICEFSRRHITVSPRVVAVVASSMTGVPASWLLNSWKPPLDGIRKTFAKELVIQTQASMAISNALSRDRHDLDGSTRPIGSFLFLRDYGFGSAELLEALALQLFDTRQVTKFDMSKYRHADSQQCDLCVSGTCSSVGGVYKHEDHLLGRELIEHVTKRPFSIIVLHNIEKANKCATKLVLHVLKFGRLVDRQGNIAYFSKTMIIMTSEVGQRYSWMFGSCNCVRVKWDLPLKEQLGHVCHWFPYLNAAKRFFSKEFLDIIDDIIIFDTFSFQQYHAATRLHLRDAVDALVQKGIIVYPSEAALSSLWSKSLGSEFSLRTWVRTWVKQNVVPELLKYIAEYGNSDLVAIYLDALVGTQQLSYRLKSGGPLDDKDFKRLRDQVKSWRLLHRNEKCQVDKIYSLKKKSFEMIYMLQQEGKTNSRFVAEMVEELKRFLALFERNAHDVAVLKEQRMVERVSVMDSRREEEKKLIAESVTEGLGRKLSHLGENDAFRIVTDAMLECINVPRDLQRPAKSFLFLGLSPAGKVDLMKGLAEIFGSKIVVQVNLQACNKSDLFSLLSERNFPRTLCSDSEAKPYRVLIVNEVEKAHISVFDSLISVLDHGLLSDHKSRQVSFSNTVVVILSHLGNKGIIRNLLACTYGTSIAEGLEDMNELRRRKIMPNLGFKDIIDDPLGCTSRAHVVNRKYYKEEQMRFRRELLTRIDEIVLTSGRPMNAARLPMKSGRHLEEGNPINLPYSLYLLLSDRPDRAGQELSSSHLEKGLIKVAERGCH